MISDNEKSYSDVTNVTTEGSPRWVGIATVLLAAVSVLALGIAWNATTHAKGAEQKLAAQGNTISTERGHVEPALVAGRRNEYRTQKRVDGGYRQAGKMTQGEVTNTRKQTSQIREDYTKKLDGVQTQLDTKASSDDVKSLGGDVTGVKTDLEATKNNLQMARGEFGTLIAKNHDEIDELRRLGERDYYEFTLTGKGSKTKMGTLTAELRDTNVKKNQFTMALYVDDMRLEKKNRSVDEPIYFYTRGTRAPLELVVNEISKDKITGYMSVPKQGATSASAAAVNN